MFRNLGQPEFRSGCSGGRGKRGDQTERTAGTSLKGHSAVIFFNFLSFDEQLLLWFWLAGSIVYPEARKIRMEEWRDM